MDSELTKKIDKEIDEYRNALIYDAKVCDWKTFEGKAGMLFDYLETIEFSALRKKFHQIFRLILVVLVLAVAALWILSSELNPAMLKYKDDLILMAVAGCVFEAFFFMDFRIVMDFMASQHRRRREKFIRNIEGDFRSRIGDPGCMSAGK